MIGVERMAHELGTGAGGTAVAALVDAIRGLYRARAPVMLAEHRCEPATDAAVDEFESRLGSALPADYRAFLLLNDVRHNFEYNFECLPFDRVVRAWERMTGCLREGVFDDGRVGRHLGEGFGNWEGGRLREVWWSPGWVPISQDSAGNMRCVDGDPGPNGVRHQLIDMEVQGEQGPFVSRYASFEAYLVAHWKHLEAGRYVVEDWGIEIR